jgi:hypothetical protein
MITDHDIATKKRPNRHFLLDCNLSTSNGDAFAVLCQHVISTLPDSLSRRRAVLAALSLCAPRSSPLAQEIREMQWHLQTHLDLAGGSSAHITGRQYQNPALPEP